MEQENMTKENEVLNKAYKNRFESEMSKKAMVVITTLDGEQKKVWKNSSDELDNKKVWAEWEAFSDEPEWLSYNEPIIDLDLKSWGIVGVVKMPLNANVNVVYQKQESLQRHRIDMRNRAIKRGYVIGTKIPMDLKDLAFLLGDNIGNANIGDFSSERVRFREQAYHLNGGVFAPFFSTRARDTINEEDLKEAEKWANDKWGVKKDFKYCRGFLNSSMSKPITGEKVSIDYIKQPKWDAIKDIEYVGKNIRANSQHGNLMMPSYHLKRLRERADGKNGVTFKVLESLLSFFENPNVEHKCLHANEIGILLNCNKPAQIRQIKSMLKREHGNECLNRITVSGFPNRRYGMYYEIGSGKTFKEIAPPTGVSDFTMITNSDSRKALFEGMRQGIQTGSPFSSSYSSDGLSSSDLGYANSMGISMTGKPRGGNSNAWFWKRFMKRCFNDTNKISIIYKSNAWAKLDKLLGSIDLSNRKKIFYYGVSNNGISFDTMILNRGNGLNLIDMRKLNPLNGIYRIVSGGNSVYMVRRYWHRGNISGKLIYESDDVFVHDNENKRLDAIEKVKEIEAEENRIKNVLDKKEKLKAYNKTRYLKRKVNLLKEKVITKKG